MNSSYSKKCLCSDEHGVNNTVANAQTVEMALELIIIIIIIKHVLIKVTLSCQRHCRGTAQ